MTMATRKRRVSPTVEIDPNDPDGLLGLEALGPVEHVFDDRGRLLYSVVVPTGQPAARGEDVPECPVALARISDARGGDTEKVDRQCRRMLAHNQKKGWGPLVVVVENDTSAFKRRKVTLPNGEVSWRTWRPGFRRIVGWLTDATHDGFLAIHLDRVVRDHRDYADLRDAVIMRSPRPKVDSLTGSLKMENNADIQAGWFWVTIAATASEDTARRVADRRLVQAEAGVYGGGCRPFGFGLIVGVDMAGDEVRDVTKQIPSEAAEIVWAAEQLLADASLRELAADLRGRKIPTSTGKEWTAGTLRDVMLRPRNAGLSVYCGEIIEGVMIKGVDEDHPPILERGTWEAVVALLTNPKRQTTTGPAPRWLGSGLYLCGHPDCVNGNPRNVMTVQQGGGKSHAKWKNKAYVCKSAAHLSRTAPFVDEYVEGVMIAQLMQPHAVKLCTPQQQVDTAWLATEANAIQEVIKDLGDLHQRRKITKAERERRTDELEAELEVVMSKLRGGAGVDPLKKLAGNPKAAQVWAAMSMPAKRAVIRRALRVTILPTRPGPPVGYKRGSGKPYFKPESISIEWLTPDTR